MRRGFRRRSRFTASSPMLAALARLVAAPGAVAFYDSAFGITLNVANVSAWAPRIGAESVTASGGAQPAYGADVRADKTGVTFDGTTDNLRSTASALAAVLDGSQAYSTLMVAKTAGGSTRAVWGVGAQATAEYIREGVNSGADWRARRTTASGSITTAGTGAVGTTNPFLVTNVYTGAAYDGWTNGVQTVTASANARAPVCDIFSIGTCFETGSPGYLFDGPIWGVLISTSQWSTVERQTLERAASIYWGLGLVI